MTPRLLHDAAELMERLAALVTRAAEIPPGHPERLELEKRIRRAWDVLEGVDLQAATAEEPEA